MNEFRADLHCHSHFSDGTLSPIELLSLAKSSDLQALAITDHDSVSAYDSAIPYAKEIGVELLPGVEFSSELNGESLHILGYAFNYQHPAIQEFCQKHHARRCERNLKILDKLASKQIFITESDINEAYQQIAHTTPHSIGRPHIALALKQKGYITEFKEAFQLYIGENKPCYVKGQFFSTQETIDVIHKGGGLAIIAHPHLISSKGLIDQLLNMNFDGIECYYGRFPPDRHERWLKIAKKKNWIITGGSDFHGEMRPHIALGCSWINAEAFDVLRSHYK